MKTQGEIESAICDGVARFELEYMGRGPKDIRATSSATSSSSGSRAC